MASQVQDKQGNYLVAFRFAGKQFTRGLNTRDPTVAASAVARVEETLMRLKRGWLALPEGTEPGIFIVSGGQLTSKPVVESVGDGKSTTPADAPPTVQTILHLYARHLTPGAKAANTLATEAIHRAHLIAQLGDVTTASFALTDLDGYLKARTKLGRDPVTIRQEIATLRVSWNWAFKRKYVRDAWTWKLDDLDWPKTSQRDPFRTWAEIERRIAGGRLTEEKVKALWECLYLDEAQVMEFLACIKDHARHPFIHPMFCFAAYTGARRGEIIRSERDDWDFAAKTVAIRQSKSDTAKEYTIREVRLHPALIAVMSGWFEVHPGGPYTITAHGREAPMDPRIATQYFRQAVAKSKWDVLHGFHVFRHSLASIMASNGKDQRVIDAILGHSTEDMTRRYRHLFPSTTGGAIDGLFPG